MMQTLPQDRIYYQALWERAIRDGKFALTEEEQYHLLCWIGYDTEEYIRRRNQYLNTGKDGC